MSVMTMIMFFLVSHCFSVGGHCASWAWW